MSSRKNSDLTGDTDPRDPDAHSLITGSPRERFIAKLQQLRKPKKDAERQQEIEKHEKTCTRIFAKMAKRVSDISTQEIFQLDPGEFKGLELEILRYAKSRNRWVWKIIVPIISFIPIFGQFSVYFYVTETDWPGSNAHSVIFVRHYKKLLELCGEDYSLYEKWRMGYR